MSAIAHILIVGGNTVSGSDQSDSAILAKLREQGCVIDVGHDAAAVINAELVVISTAVKPGNVELDAAIALGIYSYSQRTENLSEDESIFLDKSGDEDGCSGSKQHAHGSEQSECRPETL